MNFDFLNLPYWFKLKEFSGGLLTSSLQPQLCSIVSSLPVSVRLICHTVVEQKVFS